MAEYTFRLVSKLGEDRYLTVLDGHELARLWREGIITYNAEIQRGSRIVTNNNNEEIEEPFYNKSNVRNILESMVAGNYFEDMITLNLLDNDNYILDDEVEGQIFASGEINIADGQHRIRALEMIYNLNVSGRAEIDLSQFVFPVQLTNYNITKARMQFYQYSKGLKISSSRAEYFNSLDPYNEIVRSLLRNSDLAGKVELIKNTITKNEKRNIVTFATLTNALKMIYKDVNRGQIQELSAYLTEFINELFNTIPELSSYNRRSEIRVHSLKVENFMFYGYIAISKILRDVENWRGFMPLINQLDLNKESESWFGMVTKRARNGMAIVNSNDSRTYFIEKIQEKFLELANTHIETSSE